MSSSSTRILQRSMWRRNAWPRPTFWCAPSIRPGTSQTVSRFQSGVFHDADLRVQRGERIRRDFRARLGNGREQRGFAGVRITDQADLGDDAQFEQKIAFLARLARLRETRRLAARRWQNCGCPGRRARLCTRQIAGRARSGRRPVRPLPIDRRSIPPRLPCSNQFPAPASPPALRINGRLPVLVLKHRLCRPRLHPRLVLNFLRRRGVRQPPDERAAGDFDDQILAGVAVHALAQAALRRPWR